MSCPTFSIKIDEVIAIVSFVTQMSFYRSIKLLIARFKWGRGCQIKTWNIASNAELGEGVRLDEAVVVHRECRIGDRSYMRFGSKLWHGSSVGAYCSIGENVLIGAPEHPKHYLSTNPFLYQMSPAKPSNPWPEDDVVEPAIVENDVWIGNNVVIRGGVRVGTGAIIGANAVVTRSVEPYTVVAGVPARVIGRRFDQELASRLLLSHWWDLPYEELLCSPVLFDPRLLLDKKEQEFVEEEK